MSGVLESLLYLDELLKAVKGILLDGCNRENFSFTSVVTDSRAVKDRSLFVPLIGEFQDGHKYIPQSVASGAGCVFVTASVYESEKSVYETLAKNNSNCAFVIVENNLYALQAAAKAYVEKFPSLIKIAVTGSSGKTSTKEILASVFREKYNVICNAGNFNSETGLPLSVFGIRPEHEVGIFEMGMNRENEIGEIADVFKPEYAVLTNIGTAHIGILKSQENIAREKRKVFSFMDEKGAAVVPFSDSFFDFVCEGVKGKILPYGKDVPESECGVKYLRDEGIRGTVFSIDGVETHLPLAGIYNYNNALASVVLGKYLGLTAKEISSGIEKVKLPGARSEFVDVSVKENASGKSNNVTMLYDCYNANPDSMEKVLELCGSLEISGRKVMVLGDMKELGEASRKEHERIGKLCASLKFDLVIFAGEEMKYAKDAYEASGGASYRYYESSSEENVQAIVDSLIEYFKDGDFVMLKASHSMGFERIASGIKQEEQK